MHITWDINKNKNLNAANLGFMNKTLIRCVQKWMMANYHQGNINMAKITFFKWVAISKADHDWHLR